MSVTESGIASRSSPQPEQLEHQLELVVASRIGEDQIVWTIFSLFWAAQVLLTGVLFQGEFPPHPVVGIIVSLLGVVMSSAWALTQNRSLLHLERYETITKSIEMKLQSAGRLSNEHQLTMNQRFSGLSARRVMRFCCWGALVVWSIGAVLFIGYACLRGVQYP